MGVQYMVSYAAVLDALVTGLAYPPNVMFSSLTRASGSLTAPPTPSELMGSRIFLKLLDSRESDMELSRLLTGRGRAICDPVRSQTCKLCTHV